MAIKMKKVAPTAKKNSGKKKSGPDKITIEKSKDGGTIKRESDNDGSYISVSHDDANGNTHLLYTHTKDKNGNETDRRRIADDFNGPAPTRVREESEVSKNGKPVSRDVEDYDPSHDTTWHEDYDANGDRKSSDYIEKDGNGIIKKEVHRTFRKGRNKSRVTVWHYPDGTTRTLDEEWDDDGHKESDTDTLEKPDGSGRKTTTEYDLDDDGRTEGTTVTVEKKDKTGRATRRSYSMP